MKKLSAIVASLLAVSAITATQVAMAVPLPGNTLIRLHCPDTKNHGAEKITNYGTVLSGTGTERVGANPTIFPLFSSAVQDTDNIPADLSTARYQNSGTSYDPNTGVVSCQYKSSLNFGPFTLTKQVNNGVGGVVTKSSKDEIAFLISVGLKK